MTTAQHIEQLERRRFAAQVDKDVPVLNEIFADDLVYTHSNGQRDDKATYVQSVANGTSRYDSADLEDLLVRVYNDERTAIVNGTVRIGLGTDDQGQPTFIRIKYAVVYVKQPADNWQLVLWHAQKQAA